MPDKLQVGELVRILPGAWLTSPAERAGIKAGSVVRVRTLRVSKPRGFWALEGRCGYFDSGEYERNPQVRIGDRVRIKDTYTVVARYRGRVVEVEELDEDGDPVLTGACLISSEYDLVPYNTPLTYPEEPAVPEAPTAPTAPQTDFREKLRQVLISTYDTETSAAPGWNDALHRVAVALGMTITMQPCVVTCEDAT